MAAKTADQFVDSSVADDVITLDRRGEDRRSSHVEADSGEEATPRRKKQRRRHIDPTTCERDYSGQEIEFMRAMDDYKRDSGRMFPTCSEVLEVIRALGYVQLDDEQIEQLGIGVIAEPEDDANAFEGDEAAADRDELEEV